MELLSERRIERIHRAVLSGRIVPYLAAVIGTVTLLAALTVRLLARGEFNTIGQSIWWAAQTVTTVGYGDVVPQTAFSKVIAVLVMFFGIATLSITTALVTSAVVSASQRRMADHPDSPAADPHLEALRRIEQRLEALERKLG
jgi:voltage-gated potassium channel